MVLKALETGVYAGKGDVSGIRFEEFVIECVWEAGLQRVGMEIGSKKTVDEAVDEAVAAGGSSAFKNEVVASVENGCGFGLDCFTRKQERKDIPVRLVSCWLVLLVFLVAHIQLTLSVRAPLSSLVLAFPDNLIGADECVHVDLESQLERKGIKTIGA